MNRDLKDMRQNYDKDFLLEENVVGQPIGQFRKWFGEAIDSNIIEPNAMILSTISDEHMPSSRTVLLKDIDDDGFVFYTNYESDKAQDIKANPNVALIFFWVELQRQVRITGRAEKVEKSRSEEYFHSRPKESQIGAWASSQSTVIDSRDILENRMLLLTEQYKNEDNLPLPDFWGGYKVIPTMVEFWQGRPNRLHDRLRYTQEGNVWRLERLAP